jgi:hypothetical protein
MVPRPEVTGISIEMAPEEALIAVLESPYTRYPVFRESLDEIVGILHVRDLVSALHDSSIAEVELASLLRPAYPVSRIGVLGVMSMDATPTSRTESSSSARTSAMKKTETTTTPITASVRIMEPRV